MEKKKSGGWMLWIVLVLAAVLLYGAATDSPKTQKLPDDQILSDIYAKNSDLRQTGLEVTNYEVSNRQTNEELGTDTLWVSYVAENSEATYFGEVMLHYQLAETGWELATWDRGNTYYTAKYDCDPSVPLARMQELYPYPNVAINMVSQQAYADNENTFTYTVTLQENAVCAVVDSYTVQCKYDLWGGWRVASDSGEKISEVWDICGTYTINNENLRGTVELTEFEIDIPGNRVTATVSYSFTSYLSNGDIWGGPAMQQGVTYYSEAPVTVDLGGYGDGRYHTLQIGDILTLYFCGRSVNWDPIGDGLGIWVEVLGNYSDTYGEYWLYRQ